jgi:CheY-like chemotaxis protein
VDALENVTVVARDATAVQALRQALEGRGVQVTESESGILIEPQATAAAAAP